MNSFYKLSIKLFYVALQSALNEAADKVPAFLPVFAAIAENFPVYSQTAIELKIKNGFCLLRCERKLLGKRDYVLILALFGDTFNDMSGQTFIKKDGAIFRM